MIDEPPWYTPEHRAWIDRHNRWQTHTKAAALAFLATLAWLALFVGAMEAVRAFLWLLGILAR